MDGRRFDRISKALAERHLSRRKTLTTAAAGLAAGTLAVAGAGRSSVAQEATPATDPGRATPTDGPSMLFVQTYQAGSIAPKEGAEGRYTLTLEAGGGQTVYFSDRPDRIVGASPTPQFLEGLGFSEDNPPNAALVVETAPGETDVAVVELFNPLYDPVTQGVTYDVEVLANWQSEVELGLHEAPTDLAALAPSFGAAHLFIDDCADADMECVIERGNDVEEIETIRNSVHDGFCYSWSAWGCLPCKPWYEDRALSRKYWTGWCNRNPECAGRCTVQGF